MRRAVLVVAAFVSVLGSAAQAQTPPADAALARGKHEVAKGECDAAIATLIPVVRRLGATPGREAEVADAYLHLGIAYAGLGQMSPAKSQFVRALMLDPSLKLDPSTVPQAAFEAFEAARREGESEGVVSPDRRAKKKGKGKLLLALGAVGAGVGAAAAGAGGDHTTAVDIPSFVPVVTSPYIELLNANPGPGSSFRVFTRVSLTVRATNTGAVPGDLLLFWVADAVTADGRDCLSGYTLPFSMGPGGSVTSTFFLTAQCTAPFATESLEISLQDPETSARPFHASYRGGYNVTP